jgi:hypothetical protein
MGEGSCGGVGGLNRSRVYDVRKERRGNPKNLPSSKPFKISLAYLR